MLPVSVTLMNSCVVEHRISVIAAATKTAVTTSECQNYGDRQGPPVWSGNVGNQHLGRGDDFPDCRFVLGQPLGLDLRHARESNPGTGRARLR